MMRSVLLATLGVLATASLATPWPTVLPTHSRCKKLCPECTDPSCKCDDSCWPGSSLDDTPDRTCACFAQLGFCKAGEKPVYTPGKECPTCWPAENKVCDCFAAVGFCDPPKKLPETSQCSTICPHCTDPSCKCDEGCWPGKGLNATRDHTCECFAELGFCDAGKKPVYTPGKKCPSCWDPENKACDCFAAVGFCEPPATLPTESACSTLCPGCTTPDCKCDACWPGKNITATRDHTCECFAELGFCDAGKEPVYTPGKKCPSCWPRENTACMCFAAVGFCDKNSDVKVAASAVGNEVNRYPTPQASALNPYATAQAAATEARSMHPETGYFSFTFTGDGCGGQCPKSGCYEEDIDSKAILASWHSFPPDASYKYAEIVSGGCSGKKVDCPECAGMMGLSRYTLTTIV